MNWQNGGMMSLTNDAAMTARATDLADTIGNLQPDFGGLCNYQESIRLITAALCAVRDETLSQVEPYIQHRDTCSHWLLLNNPTAKSDLRLRIGATIADCTCGLAALRAGGGGAG